MSSMRRFPRLAVILMAALVAGFGFSQILALTVRMAQAAAQFGEVGGQTRYVAVNGADAGDCSNRAAPCRTAQYAVDACQDGDTILISTGVYTGTQARSASGGYAGQMPPGGIVTQVVHITRSLALRGGYAADWSAVDPALYPTIMDAQRGGRVMVVLGPVSVWVENLTLTGGTANGQKGATDNNDAGGGVYVYSSTLTLRNTIIHSNTVASSSARGGGLYQNMGFLTLEDSVVSDNGMSNGQGHGVALINSQVVVTASRFTGNQQSGLVRFGEGGGLYVSGGRALVQNSAITGNVAGSGAGVALVNQGVYTLTGNLIAGNLATGQGAGVKLYDSQALFERNTIAGNKSTNGMGGMYIEWTTGIQIIDNDISLNADNDLAGGIYAVHSSQVQVIGNRLALNTSNSGSGAAYLYNVSGLFARNVITGNVGGNGHSGGITAKQSGLLFASNVLAANRSPYGSALLLEDTTDQDAQDISRLTHNSIISNTGASAVRVSNHQAYFTHTLIVSQALAIEAVNINALVWMTDTFWSAVATRSTGNVTRTADVSGAHGLAADGYHLTAASGAVDTAMPSAYGSLDDFDVEGQPRPARYGFDYGADELDGTAFWMTQHAWPKVANAGERLTYTLRVTVTGGTANRLIVSDVLPLQQQAVSVDSAPIACSVVPGYGGGIVCDAGTQPAGTTIAITLVAQVAPNLPPGAPLPMAMTNALVARSDEAGYTLRLDTHVHRCLARLNDDPTEYSTLQAAVDAAQPGDLVKVAGGVCAGMNTGGAEQVAIAKHLTLRGGYAVEDWTTYDWVARPITLDAQNLGRGVFITGSVTVTIEGVRITRGQGSNGGGLWARGGWVGLSFSTIDHSTAVYGGGVYIEDAGFSINQNVIQTNTAQYGGGLCLAFSRDDLSLPAHTMSNTIEANVATVGGGGLYAMGIGPYYAKVGSLKLQGDVLRDNTARYEGGGAWFVKTVAVVTGSTWLSNTSTNGGGASVSDARVAFVDSLFVRNRATGGGGAISTWGGLGATMQLGVLSSTFLANTAVGPGGGVSVGNGDGTDTVEIDQAHFEANTAGGDGGAAVVVANATIVGSTIVSNTAAATGGGLCLGTMFGTARFERNMVRFNQAGGDGGGILWSGSDGRFRNNVIADNRSGRNGSGLWLDSRGGTATHLTHNSGGNGVGVFVAGSASTGWPVVMSNTIVASHTVGISNTGGMVQATLTLFDGNAADTRGVVDSQFPIAGSAAFAADGYRLTAASAARDAGTSTAMAQDIDLNPRWMGPFPDLGAHEYPYRSDLVLSKRADRPASWAAGGTITYTVVVTAGPDTDWAANARLTDVLEPRAAVAAASIRTTGGECAIDGVTFTCDLHALVTGTARMVSLVVTTTSEYYGVLTNTATVMPTDAIDPHPADNTAVVTLTIAPPAPDLSVAKFGLAYARPGQTMVYTLTWANAGSRSATRAVLTDTLPVSMALLAASHAPAVNGCVVSWNLGDLVAGAGGQRYITVSVDADAPNGAVLTNTATITSAALEHHTSDNDAALATVVVDPGGADLAVAHAAYPLEAMAGDEVEYPYVVLVTNTGVIALDAALVNPLPPGAVYVDGTASATLGTAGYDATGARVTWSGRLAPGQAATIGFSLNMVACAGVECGVVRNTAQASASGVPLTWQTSAETRVRCPDVLAQVSATRQIQVGEAQVNVYTASVRYANQSIASRLGDVSAPGRARLALTISGAWFHDATPAPTRAISSTRWEWDLGALATGATGEIPLRIEADAAWREPYSLGAVATWVSLDGAPMPAQCQPEHASAATSTYPFEVSFEQAAGSVRPVFKADGRPQFDVAFYQKYGYWNADPQVPPLAQRRIDMTWSNALQFDAQLSTPLMSFQLVSPTHMTWSSAAAFWPAAQGWVRVKGLADGLTPVGTELSSASQMSFALGGSASWQGSGEAQAAGPMAPALNAGATSVKVNVPAFPPRITEPGDGLICPGPIDVNGLAPVGAQVRLFDNAVLKATARPDASGVFSATLDLSAMGRHAIHAVAVSGIIVNSTGDAPDATIGDGLCDTGATIDRDGQPEPECTLRAAIQESNATPGVDMVAFDIPTSDPHYGTAYPSTIQQFVIVPGSALPVVTDAAVIDASGQPNGSVVLNGRDAGGASGLHITAGGTTLRGLVIQRFGGHGILIENGGGNRIQDNQIGTHASGLYKFVNQPLGNLDGVHITGSKDNVIGGSAATDRNLISGNLGDGVEIEGSGASGNVVAGNFIGTDIDGVNPAFDGLGNAGNGVFVNGAPNNLIGGLTMLAQNLIAGNRANGVYIKGNTASGNRVQANFFGVDPTGAYSDYFGESFDSKYRRTTIPDLRNRGDGILIEDAPNNQVGGTTGGNLISGSGGSGVHLKGAGASGNIVAGNLIGTNITGRGKLVNLRHGVHIENAPNNRIGGTEAGARNLISGNGSSDVDSINPRRTGHGVYIQGALAAGNVVQGNFIGTDISGRSQLALYYRPGYVMYAESNGDNGVTIRDAPNNIVGGPTAAERNVISGNAWYGVEIAGSGATGNVIQGNIIGPDVSATQPLTRPQDGLHPRLPTGNGEGGVYVGYDANGNTIGGEQPGAGNLIGFNGLSDRPEEPGFPPDPLGSGVEVAFASLTQIRSNTVFSNGIHGVVVYGNEDFMGRHTALSNTIQSNAIYGNGELGIDLQNDGLTFNDVADADDGPNRLQNSPVVTRVIVSGSQARVAGALHARPNTMHRVEFFANTRAGGSGYYQGQVWLGAIDVATDGAGNATFEATLVVVKLAEAWAMSEAELESAAAAQAWIVTATATDPGGNTSEFSIPAIVVNETGDEADLDPSDGACDVNAQAPGAQCTLRAALQTSNATAGIKQILFDIASPAGVTPTILPKSQLPAISQPAIVDATSQPGANQVSVDGSQAGKNADGLIVNARDTIIRGLVVANFIGNGILGQVDELTLHNVQVLNNCEWGIRTSGRLVVRPILGLSAPPLNRAYRNGRDVGCLGGGVWAKSMNARYIEASYNGGPGLMASGDIDLWGVYVDHNRGHGIKSFHGAIEIVSPPQNMWPQGNRISANDGRGIDTQGSDGVTMWGTIDILDNRDWGIAAPASLANFMTSNPAGSRVNGNGKGAGCWETDDAGSMTPYECRGGGVWAESVAGRLLEASDNGGPGLFAGQGSVSMLSVRANGNQGAGIQAATQVELNRLILSYPNQINGNQGAGIYTQYGHVMLGQIVLQNNAGQGIDAYNSDVNINVIGSGFVRWPTEQSLISGNGGGPACYLSDDVGVISAYDCGNEGIRAKSIDARGATVAQNKGYGVRVSKTARLESCLVTGNQGWGIRAYRVKLTANQILSNTLGGVWKKAGALPALVASAADEVEVDDSTLDAGHIAGNGGAGLLVEDGETMTISRTNIVANAGLALENRVPTLTVAAQGNWWGSAAGPGGAISGSVDAANWRTQPVSVVVSSPGGVISATAGATTTIVLIAQNYGVPTDTLNVVLADSHGWLNGALAYPAPLQADTGSTSIEISLTVPVGVGPDAIDLVTLSVSSQADPAAFDSATLVVVPVLSVPPHSAGIDGPAVLTVNRPETYTVGVRPVTASLPITLFWSLDESGLVTRAVNAVTDSVVLTQAWPGRRVLRVVALNAHGVTTGEMTIDVIAPPAQVEVAGSLTATAGSTSFVSATVAPITATPPLTFVWFVSGQAPVTHVIGGLEDGLGIAWPAGATGAQHILVVAGNAAGAVTGTLTIDVVAASAQSAAHSDGEARPPRLRSPSFQSQKSNVVTVDVQRLGFCPVKSYWTGVVKAGPLAGQPMTFRFRDANGNFSTSNWQMPGVYGFWDTDLWLWGCGCDDPAATQWITVTSDSREYGAGPRSSAAQWFTFKIARNHQVRIRTQCGDQQTDSDGVVLIDPDGYVFDATKGGRYDGDTGMFSPVQAVSGVTVTAYVSMSEWGGWVPWPAHVYANQVNPQVTDDRYPDHITTTGYFAFFTPPGFYYLKVEGIPGYQEWRSPVVQVITQIVHVNVPYTPDPPVQARNWPEIRLTADGPDLATVTVPVGSAVAWRSDLRVTDTVTDVMNWLENPIARTLSARHPLTDVLGWDGGMLEPGRVYRRVFTELGTYEYSDGLGHTGKVVVQVFRYLPIVMQAYSSLRWRIYLPVIDSR